MGLKREWFGTPPRATCRPVEAVSPGTVKEPLFPLNSHTCVGAEGSSWAESSECALPAECDTEQFRRAPGTLNDLSIGIVVPVLNESKALRYFLTRLYEVSRACYPVVVVDGGSTDDSVQIAGQFFHTETISTPSRGVQMNNGARCLLTDVLLFLHADSELPRGFDFHIQRALADPAVLGGCFRLEFDARHPILRFYSWFTKFPGRFFHYGDQGFFVRRDAFCQMGGFSALPFLEDVDFLHRLKRHGKFVVLPTSVRTSARRFLKRGVVRQQLANVLVVALFELGVSAGRLAKFYEQVR